MATADQIKALIKSHAQGDDSRFYSVAGQVASKAASSGHTKIANELRELISNLKNTKSVSRRTASVTHILEPQGDLAGLLQASHPDMCLADLVLDKTVSDKLIQILVEQRQRDRLEKFDLKPISKVLLTGAPGTGKTSSANVLASELNIPLFVVRLDGLLTKFMGETAVKLRQIFDALEQTRAVYLFDEVDALASERTTGNDVGEIRRVLNSFLQFLEKTSSDSIIVAATNHPRLLDAALFRRFDLMVQYPLPDRQTIIGVIKNYLAFFDISDLVWEDICEAALGLSQAEIAAACADAAKKVVLRGEDNILMDDIIISLQDRKTKNSFLQKI